MQIQIRINEEGALRNQRHAFGNRFTLVSELLQNARRAGARLIEIHHDAEAQRLVVEDNGHGIQDFQKLLSLHESGWDAATCAEERPFGVGFSKCLYAATRCIVASGQRRVDFETAAALDRSVIEVEQRAETDIVAGTRIELHGVNLADLVDRIDELCAGFPVPVWFNGRPLVRPMAEGRLAPMASPIGPVHLAGVGDGQSTQDTWVFLQGFCVLRPAWSCREAVNVVHLDPQLFMARLPDRDRLIDEDVQRLRIDAELKACWRRILKRAKAELPTNEFIETYYEVLRGWGHLDLLDDLDHLPAQLCSRICGYPVQPEHGEREFLSPLPAAPTREAIESGLVQLVALDAVGEDNAPRWMLARARGWLVFDWIGVSAEHWVMRHVLFLEERSQRVTPVREWLRSELEGRWIQPTLVLCEQVHVQVGDDEAWVDDAAVCHEGEVFVPDGERTGSAVEQYSSCTDENDVFQMADRDADVQALADLLLRLRAVDPLQTLDSLLLTLDLGRYPLLRGKRFELTVGDGQTCAHRVEPLEEWREESGHA